MLHLQVQLMEIFLTKTVLGKRDLVIDTSDTESGFGGQCYYLELSYLTPFPVLV